MPDGACKEAARHQVGDAVRRLRGSESQKSLASRAGIREATLCAIETGAASPRINTLGKIADALGQPLAAFMAGPANGDARDN